MRRWIWKMFKTNKRNKCIVNTRQVTCHLKPQEQYKEQLAQAPVLPGLGRNLLSCPYLPGAQAQEQRGTDLLLGALG